MTANTKTKKCEFCGKTLTNQEIFINNDICDGDDCQAKSWLDSIGWEECEMREFAFCDTSKDVISIDDVTEEDVVFFRKVWKMTESEFSRMNLSEENMTKFQAFIDEHIQ